MAGIPALVIQVLLVGTYDTRFPNKTFVSKQSFLGGSPGPSTPPTGGEKDPVLRIRQI
jgi:hypothetical protein